MTIMTIMMTFNGRMTMIILMTVNYFFTSGAEYTSRPVLPHICVYGRPRVRLMAPRGRMLFAAHGRRLWERVSRRRRIVRREEGSS